MVIFNSYVDITRGHVMVDKPTNITGGASSCMGQVTYGETGTVPGAEYRSLVMTGEVKFSSLWYTNSKNHHF